MARHLRDVRAALRQAESAILPVESPAVSSTPDAAALPPRAAWLMLLALTSGFAMSQAFRTLPAIVAPPLQAQFGLSPQQLGLFAGAFHFAFGGLQLVMGLGIDVWGPRRTVLAVSPLAIAGALLAAMAPGYGLLLAAQVLIGIGCAPAFVVCTVFIARAFPAQRFAAVSGATLGLGSVGLLLTGTPLAWLVAQLSWRAAFVALAMGSALGWLAIALLVRDTPVPGAEGARPGIAEGLRGYGELLRLPYTWGIVVMGCVTYASFLALRGLWLGPMLVEGHGLSLVVAGHVLLAVSVMQLFGPPLFGRLDPGERSRRRWLMGFNLLLAAMFALMAAVRSVALDMVVPVVMSLMSGYMILQYADVKSAYPARMIGRALAVFTMAMFLGVALMQWLTGLVASAAAAQGFDPFASVLAFIAGLLVLGTAAFRWLPAPPSLAPARAPAEPVRTGP